MKYLYPKKINIEDLNVIEIRDKFIIKNESLLNIYGIIIHIDDCVIKKEYNKYKIIINNSDLRIYDDLLNDSIENYSKIIRKETDNETDNKTEYIITHGDKIKDYFLRNKTNLYVNIHYVRKSCFLNIPKISIL